MNKIISKKFPIFNKKQNFIRIFMAERHIFFKIKHPVVDTFLGKPLLSLQGEAPKLNPSLLHRGSIWVPHPVHPPMEGATLDRKS